MVTLHQAAGMYDWAGESEHKPIPSNSHDGSMVLLYMVTWIPSIYPLYVSIYIYIFQHHGFYGIETSSSGNHEINLLCFEEVEAPT